MKCKKRRAKPLQLDARLHSSQHFDTFILPCRPDNVNVQPHRRCCSVSGDEGVQRARPKVYNHGDIFSQQKKNKYGIEYGWNSTVFTTVENFWAERDFEIPELDAGESYEKIRQQILLLNPTAEEKTIWKFIRG